MPWSVGSEIPKILLSVLTEGIKIGKLQARSLTDISKAREIRVMSNVASVLVVFRLFLMVVCCGCQQWHTLANIC